MPPIIKRQYVNQAGSFEGVVEKPERGYFGKEEKGTPFIRIPIVITEDGPCRGQLTIWKGYLTDAAYENTILALVAAFRFNGDLEGLYAGRVSFEGLPCNVAVEIETYNGRRMAKAQWLNPPGGGGGGKAKAMEEGQIKDIFKRLGGEAKKIANAALKAAGPAPAPVAAPAPTPAPPAPAQAATPLKPQETVQPAPDDDVPF